ncbi:unnamed protein product [marine sediment metagenome]|uniref:HNH nuclease domain-containing protein n=1 Tax=marine sediment metagenome TaxID=412755 RepID=X0X9C6_9ZZZZ
MPWAPKRPCAVCGVAAVDGRCAEHPRPIDPRSAKQKSQPLRRPAGTTSTRRPSPHARGYGKKWQKISRAYRAAHPVCERCGWRRSHAVDHVIPTKQGGHSGAFNLQALCVVCHGMKTAARDGAFGNPIVDIDF